MTDLVRTDRALCPLRSIGQAEPVPCAGKLCAWWDGPLGYCSIFTLADSMRGVESLTGALTVALENLEKSVPASVTSTSGDEAGSVRQNISAITISENKRFVNGKIKTEDTR